MGYDGKSLIDLPISQSWDETAPPSAPPAALLPAPAAKKRASARRKPAHKAPPEPTPSACKPDEETEFTRLAREWDRIGNILALIRLDDNQKTIGAGLSMISALIEQITKKSS
ncbi:MAG: hypothetical protein FWD39_01975 [Clostridiales bacterium]|nr:hypothetical protein [Clostridiales bacterium]